MFLLWKTQRFQSIGLYTFVPARPGKQPSLSENTGQISLESEGFIHFSKPEQLVGTANLFFRDTPDLILLWIDPARLVQPLRWDPVGEQVFPHLYGPLNLSAVMAVNDYQPDADGVFRQAPVLTL